MKSISETGHAKNVAVFEKLISYCTDYGAAYNPSRNELKPDELVKKRDQARTSLANVKKVKALLAQAVNERQTLFAPLRPLATRVVNAFKATGASLKTIQDLAAVNRKMQGRRALPPKNAPEQETAPENPETQKRTISVSQQSFDNQIEHLLRIIALLEIEPLYQPNEPELQLETLRDYAQKLRKANSNVIEATSAHANAIAARDQILYAPHTGMVDTALDVKKYVLSVFGKNSPEYRRIGALSFRK